MTSVAIVYFSARGSTCQLAEAASKGVGLAGWYPKLLPILGSDIQEGRFRNEEFLRKIDSVNAVIWGSPTYMGGPAAQFKAFADASSDRWETQCWRDKVSSGFTVGTNLNGDQTSALQYFHVLSMQHGMLWLGVDIPGGHHPAGLNRLGVHMGASAQTLGNEISLADLATVEHLGTRIVRFAKATQQLPDA